MKQTEYWVGFINSSPKITLVFTGEDQEATTSSDGPLTTSKDGDDGSQSSTEVWSCHVCGYRNLARSGTKCTLCGVQKLQGESSALKARPLSSSSASQLSNDRSGASSPAPNGSNGLLACPACTYLNHPSMMRCEICESPLGTISVQTSRPETPFSSRPQTPAIVAGSTGKTPAFVRLSFRKGGIQPFYAALKKSLLAKEWEGQDSKRRRGIVAEAHQGINGDQQQHRLATVGIDGILKTIDLDARDRDDEMQEALSDLEALMTRAKEMVSYYLTCIAAKAETRLAAYRSN